MIVFSTVRSFRVGGSARIVPPPSGEIHRSEAALTRARRFGRLRCRFPIHRCRYGLSSPASRPSRGPRHSIQTVATRVSSTRKPARLFAATTPTLWNIEAKPPRPRPRLLRPQVIPAVGARPSKRARRSYAFLPFSDQLLQLGQLFAADFTRGPQVADHVRETALKQPVQQVIRHAACHGVGTDSGPINKTAAVHPMQADAAAYPFTR